VRIVATALATAQTVAIGLASLFALFVSSFPWENLEPEDEAEFDRIAALVIAGFVFAAATAVTIAANKLRWAVIAFVAQFAVSMAALSFALSHSDHSDGRLLAFALGVELVGIAALVISNRQAAAHG
jgi:hypothetical protein